MDKFKRRKQIENPEVRKADQRNRSRWCCIEQSYIWSYLLRKRCPMIIFVKSICLILFCINWKCCKNVAKGLQHKRLGFIQVFPFVHMIVWHPTYRIDEWREPVSYWQTILNIKTLHCFTRSYFFELLDIVCTSLRKASTPWAECNLSAAENAFHAISQRILRTTFPSLHCILASVRFRGKRQNLILSRKRNIKGGNWLRNKGFKG